MPKYLIEKDGFFLSQMFSNSIGKQDRYVFAGSNPKDSYTYKSKAIAENIAKQLNAKIVRIN